MTWEPRVRTPAFAFAFLVGSFWLLYACRMRVLWPCLLILVPMTSSCGGPEDSEAHPPFRQEGGITGDVTVTPGCEPITCADAGANCGTIPDGCGGKIACGTCAAGEKCGGGGPNVCGTGECFPKTCAQVGASCGFASDMCSEALDCGGCAVPQTCGGGGVLNQCGCTPKTCTQLFATCGTIPNGCKGILDCGTCAAGQTCGGGGPNMCGTNPCSPKSCAQIGASCGLVSDGCSEAIDCGKCTSPDTCGGLGKLNQCGCMPRSCSQMGASCGKAQSGCGFEIECGTCPNGEECGSAGVANQCGCNCTLPHASTACQGGQCVITACEAGWDDCDKNPANGCEADLSADPHCGGCNVSCDDGNACTIGDACVAGNCVPGATKTCSSPPDGACYETVGSCDPATGSCAYSPKQNGTPCGATTCDDWGSCQWNGECSESGTKNRACTDFKCSTGTCSPSNRSETGTCSRSIPNGTSCSAGYCCSNSCVARNSKTNCGSCGVNCGTNSCVKITGLNYYSCTCSSNSFCRGAGFGDIATCYDGDGQMICDCQCSSGTSCGGQCAGGGTCADVSGHNYCHY